jgi:hypothetical protein
MVCQKQFDYRFSDSGDAAVIGDNFHALPHVIGAGGQKFPLTVAFHNADATDRAPAQIGVVAEGGDKNIRFPRRIQYLCAFRHCYLYAVNA